jgi:chromosome segregation ATPase
MEIINGLMNNTQKPQSADEVISTLCDRMAHSRLASDKRATILTLKGFSRQYREQVVANGLRALIHTIREFSEDTDLLKATLETLLILFIRGEGDHDMTRSFISQQSRLQNGKYPSPLLMKEEANTIDQFSLWIADEITQDNQNISSLVSLLENTDFYVRLYTLQLLEALVSTRPLKSKDLLLNSPLGIPSLVQVLKDQHDPVRNEAVLLLMSLAKDNFNIQKLIAFENTFETLFEIIHEEGDIRGSIVVQDCLALLSNLLQYNVSNQKLFMETNCLPKLVYLIGEPFNDDVMVWNEQRLQNISATLDIVRLFVMEGNESTKSNQDALNEADVFFSILRLSFSVETPNSIRSTALLTVADLISENEGMQLKFSSIDVPYIDPSLPAQLQNFKSSVPVITALLNWCLYVNSVHVFDIRVASAHLLKAYFSGNQEAKKGFIEDQIALFNLPESEEKEDEDEKDEISKDHQNQEPFDEADGAILNRNLDTEINGTSHPKQAKDVPIANIFQVLLDYDPEIKLNPYKIWFSSFILIHIIHNNDELKRMVQRISSGDENEGEEVISAIQSISELLISSLNTQDQRISIGYLLILIDWLYEDPEADNDFLKDPTTVKSLLTHLSQSSLENGITQGLITILLGVAFEFSSKSSPIPRPELHSLIVRMLGKDNYGFKVLQFKENPLFSEFKPEDIFDPKRDETGLPEVFFHPSVVLLIKDNFYRIKNTLNQNPNLESNGRISYEKFDLLNKSYHELKVDYEQLQTISENVKQDTEALLIKANADLTEVTLKHGESLKDRESLEAKHNELNDKYSSTFEEFVLLKKLHQSLNESSSKQLKELKDTSQQLGLKTTEIENLKTQLKEITEQKQKAEDGINKMSRELFQLSKAKDGLEAQVKKLEKEIHNHEKSNATLQSSLKQRSDDLKGLNKKLLDLNNLLKASTNSKIALEKELSEVRGNDTKKSNLIEQLTEKLRSLATSHNDLITEKESLEKEALRASADFGTEVQSLRSKLSDLEATNAELISEIDRLKAANEQHAKSFDAARTESESKFIELNGEFEKLSVTNEQLKLQLEASKKTSEKNAAEVEALTKQLQDSNEEYTKSKSHHQKQLDSHLSDHSNKLSELQKSHNLEKVSYGNKIKTLESQISSSNAEKDKLIKNIDQNKKESDELLERISDTSSKLQSAESELSKTRSEIESLKAERDALLTNLEESEKNLRAQLSELESAKLSLDGTVRHLEKELDDNALEFETKEDEYKNTINSLRESISSLEEEKKTLSSSLEFISERIDAKDKEYETLFQQTKNKSAEIEELNSKIRDLRNAESENEIVLTEKGDRIKILEKEKNELSETLAAKEGELKKRESSIDALNDKLSFQKESHENSIKQLESKALELENALNLKTKGFEKERALLSENTDSATKEYSERVTKLEDDIKQLEKKNQIKVEVLNRQKDKLSEKLEELQAQKKSLTEELDSKSIALLSSSTELQKLKDELETVNKELDENKKKSKQLAELQGNLKAANAKISTLQSEAEEIRLKTNEAEAQLKEKGKILSELKSSTSKEASNLKEENARLQAKTDQATKESSTLHGKIKKFEDETSKLQKEVRDLETKLADIRKESKAEISEKDDEISLVKGNVIVLNEKVSALQQENDNLSNEFKSKNDSLINENTQLHDQISTLESRDFHSLEVANDELSAELEQLKKQFESLKAISDQKEAIEKELNSVKESTVPRSELEDLMLVLDDLETKKSKYKKQSKELGGDVSSGDEDDDDEDDEDDEDDDEDD